jgi:hypothetical protein
MAYLTKKIKEINEQIAENNYRRQKAEFEGIKDLLLFPQKFENKIKWVCS